MSDLKMLPKLRDCGKLESFSTARHHLGFYNNVGVTATYTLSQPHSISNPLPNLIYPALRKVIAQHSILSAIPLNENTTSPYFAQLPQIDLDRCVTFIQRAKAAPKDGENDEELDTILEEEHNRNFKEDIGARPFWRAFVLYDHALAPTNSAFTCTFIFHHAIGDGSSGLVFHRALLAALQALPYSAESVAAEVEPPNPIVDCPTASLLPPLEDLHALPLSLGYLLKQQWNEWFPPSTEGLWTGKPIPSFIPRMRFMSLVLSREITSLLVQLSRKHGVTMTATLQCLLASATFANLHDEEWKILRASGPISLRRFLKLPEEQGDINEQMGTFVGTYSFEHDRPSQVKEGKAGFDWAETLSVKREMTAELEKELKDTNVNLLRYVGNVNHFFEKRVGQRRQESFELSNVGVLKINKTERVLWDMGRCVFSQSASVTGPAFCVSAVTGGDGCAVLGFSWLTGAHEDGWMEAVMAAMRLSVQGLVGDNSERT